jgi:hypothetical protein
MRRVVDARLVHRRSKAIGAGHGSSDVMRRLVLVLMTAAIAAILPSQTASAWWITGHTVVNRTGVATLPAEVPDFLRRQIDWIGARSMAPDSWRDSTEPSLRAIEIPNHNWFIESIPVLSPQLPRSRNEFIILAQGFTSEVPNAAPAGGGAGGAPGGSAGSPARGVRSTGTLPYAIIENYERLKVAFRAWRALRDKHEDTRFIEMDAAFYVGWLGHYVGDGGMPLHTSIHHNGWVGANPNAYARDREIHDRFEGEFVDLIELTEKDIRDRVPPARQLEDPFTAFLAYLDRSHTRVEQVYALDLRKAYEDASNREARELVYVCTSEAATMLRDLIFTAWRASGL